MHRTATFSSLVFAVALSGCGGEPKCPDEGVYDAELGGCVPVELAPPSTDNPAENDDFACGANAANFDGLCDCVPGYVWCTDDPTEANCCLEAYEGDDNDGTDDGADGDTGETDEPDIPVDPSDAPNTLTVFGAQIAETDGEGWPWDPGHMSTEPDVYFSVSINDTVVFTSAPSVLDSFAPTWNLDVPITVKPGDTLVVGIWDDDGMGDDELGLFPFSFADMVATGDSATLTSEFVPELKLGFRR